MCIAFLAYLVDPHIKLIVGSNRDEFYARPTSPLDLWHDEPAHIVGGRDLVRGGTWFGVTRSGRLAILTNFRVPLEQAAPDPELLSRGAVTTAFLRSRASPREFLGELDRDRSRYGGFNLIVGTLKRNGSSAGDDEPELYWYSNRSGHGPLPLLPGHVYGVSNALLDTPWPKLQHGKKLLSAVVERHASDPALASSIDAKTRAYHQSVLEIMADRTRAHAAHLPDTGCPPDFEHALSSIFVDYVEKEYGTRNCACVTFDDERIVWTERYRKSADEWAERSVTIPFVDDDNNDNGNNNNNNNNNNVDDNEHNNKHNNNNNNINNNNNNNNSVDNHNVDSNDGNASTAAHAPPPVAAHASSAPAMLPQVIERCFETTTTSTTTTTTPNVVVANAAATTT